MFWIISPCLYQPVSRYLIFHYNPMIFKLQLGVNNFIQYNIWKKNTDSHQLLRTISSTSIYEPNYELHLTYILRLVTEISLYKFLKRKIVHSNIPRLVSEQLWSKTPQQVPSIIIMTSQLKTRQGLTHNKARREESEWVREGPRYCGQCTQGLAMMVPVSLGMNVNMQYHWRKGSMRERGGVGAGGVKRTSQYFWEVQGMSAIT